MAQQKMSFRAKQVLTSMGAFLSSLIVMAIWFAPQIRGEEKYSDTTWALIITSWCSLVLILPIATRVLRWWPKRKLQAHLRDPDPMPLTRELAVTVLAATALLIIPSYWQTLANDSSAIPNLINLPALVSVVGLSYFCMFVSNQGHVFRALYPVKKTPALHLHHHLKAGSVWLIAAFWGYGIGMGQLLESPFQSAETSGVLYSASFCLITLLFGLIGYLYHILCRGWLFRHSQNKEAYVVSMAPLVAILLLVLLSPALWFGKVLLITDIDLVSENVFIELLTETLHLDNPDLWVNFIYGHLASVGIGLVGWLFFILCAARALFAFGKPARTLPESFWIELSLAASTVLITASHALLLAQATLPIEGVAVGVACGVITLAVLTGIALCWVYLITLSRWLDVGIAYVAVGRPSLINHIAAFFFSMFTLGIASSLGSNGKFDRPYTWFVAAAVMVILLMTYLQRSKLHKVIAAQTEELERDKIALEALDQQKTHFFQTVSHELRTPLTLILTPLERTLKQYPDNEEIETASSNARRLLRLVNQLLDFQKLSANRYDLALQPRNLVPILSRCADYFRSAASGRNIDFVLTVGETPLTGSTPPIVARIDVDAFEKVAMNYLSNALKYTPNQGRIELNLRAKKNFATLSVIDTGPGIAKDQQNQLFEIFTQVDGSTTREFEGTGIGLALVKELTEGMEGQVGVESDTGKGSSFWASFPLTSAEAVAEHIETSDKTWLIADTPSQSVVEQDTVEFVESPGRGRVLVVDDNRDMRSMVKRSLRDNGYNVSTAVNGRDGVEKTKTMRPDIIVSDWMMPELSGPELVAAIRADEELKGTPIILLTAKTDEASKLMGTDIGADAFLGKPFNEAELSSTVRNLLHLKQGEKEIQRLNRYLTESVCKRYLPPDLIQEILDGTLSMDKPAELRHITVLFSDLKGFTSTSESLGATEIADLLNEYLTAMNDIIFEHGGTIDKFIGDAIMVIFGAPKEMDIGLQAERAAACAKAMQHAMESMAKGWESRGASHLAMRIGIHQGPAVVGNFGSDRRSDYTCIGPTVNLAARIESSAEPGQVFISETIHGHLDQSIAEPAGEFAMKGVSEEQLLYRLKMGGLS